MIIVHQPHRCPLPDVNFNLHNTVLRCPTCGTIWVARKKLLNGWFRLSWWHFGVRDILDPVSTEKPAESTDPQEADVLIKTNGRGDE